MSIEIVVRDPANTSPADLGLVIALLQRFAHSGQVQSIPVPDLPNVGALNGDDAAAAFEAGAQPADAAFGGAAAATPEAAFAPAPLVPNAPPPPAAAAPSTPTNGAPPAPDNGASTVGQRDSAGMPWDGRIHAKSSTGPGGVTVANGTWRKKAKVDPALVAEVEGQLRALMAAPAPAVQVPPVGSPFTTGAGLPNAAPPPPTSLPASPSAAVGTNPGSAGSAAATSYAEFIQRAGMAMGAQKITIDEVNAECAKMGVPDITLLQQRMDLFPFVAAGVQAILNARGA